MTTAAKPPDECSSEEIDKFCEFVRMGGEVESQGLTNRIKKAALLVFLYSGKDLIGVAAIKNPNAGYKAEVFQKATATALPEGFALELGWVYVDPEHRGKGLSRKLVEAALASAEKQNVFATSRTDNKAMHKTLLKFGFSKEGRPYRSGMSEHNLELFVLMQKPGD